MKGAFWKWFYNFSWPFMIFNTGSAQLNNNYLFNEQINGDTTAGKLIHEWSYIRAPS